MNSPSKSVLVLLVPLAMNCGGRSDSTEQIWGQSDFGGVSSTGGAPPAGGYSAAGGNPGNGGYFGFGGWMEAGGGYLGIGGSPSAGGATVTVGGWVSFGGTASKGGTTSKGGAGGTGGVATTSTSGSCCAARTTSGCVTAVVQACVCAVDSFCCLGSWDSYCVAEVEALKCGVCATGVGGGTSVGGYTSKGGSSGLGGSTTRGGTTSTLGGNTSTTTNRGGATALTTASGGTTALSSGGTTAISTGGTPIGGSSANTTTRSAGGAVSTVGGATSTVAVPSTLIDDFEDGNGELPQIAGRVGYFYTMNDATLTGKQLPVYGSVIFDAKAITDRAQSAYAIWTAGSGFTDWGAGLGVYLNTNQAQGRFYNASAYRGVTFWARVDEGTANVLRFNISDVASVSDGGVCTSCWDHFGTTVTLTTTWRRYTYLFSQLTTRGWAVPSPAKLDTSKIRGFEFSMQPSVSFSFYIDDLAFVQ